ncbi:MAG: VanZ family protein [Planctomycetota bacterium]
MSAPSAEGGEAASPRIGALRGIGRAMLSVPGVIAWTLPVAWAAGIFFLSSQSRLGGEAAWWELGGFTANLAHPFVFGLLALLLVAAAPRRGAARSRWTAVGPVGALWIGVLVVLYGTTDELHQSLVEGRDASLLDLLADAVGAFSVLVVIVYLGRADANDRGLVVRLAIGALASVVAAVLSTLWGWTVGRGPWPF